MAVMPRKRPPLLDDADWLRREYVETTRTLASLASELGCTQQTVLNALRRAGISSRPRGGRAPVSPGDRFGRLVVVEETDDRLYGRARGWRCRCDCGGEIVTVAPSLVRGMTQSCGC